jgi:hypothetical protein
MTRSDTLAILFAIILLPLLYYQLWRPQSSATHARIIDSHQHITVTRLEQAKQLNIHGELGDSVLNIEDGKIRFAQSPCKGKVCIHRGWLQYSGEVMACLPNKVIVKLDGGQARFDSINF